jgi:hypothetical protein
VISCYVLETQSALETPESLALDHVIILIEKREFVVDYRIPRRQLPTSSGPCANQCSVVNQAISTCFDDSCFCPVLTASGAGCSQCYATANITAASALSSASSICLSEFPLLTSSIASLAAACSVQCNLINQALSECFDDSCFCPTALASGPQCSSCLATVNIAEAQDIGSAMQICQIEFATGATGTSYPTTTFVPLRTGSAATSTPTSTSTSSKSSSGLAPAAIGGIVAGFLVLFAAAGILGFCFLRRYNNRQSPQSMYQPAFADPVAPIQEPAPRYAEPESVNGKIAIVDENNTMETEVPSARLRYLDPDDEATIVNQTDSGAVGGRTARDY